MKSRYDGRGSSAISKLTDRASVLFDEPRRVLDLGTHLLINDLLSSRSRRYFGTHSGSIFKAQEHKTPLAQNNETNVVRQENFQFIYNLLYPFFTVSLPAVALS